MSPRIRFHPTDAISIAKVLYLIWEQTKAGLVLQQVDNPSVTRSFKPGEVVALLAAPDTRLRRGYFSGHKAVSRLRSGQKYLATVPEKARSKALWKGVFVRVYLDWEQDGKVNRTEASIRESIAEMKSRVDEMCAQSQHIGKPAQAGTEVKTRKAPSPRALLTWVRRFEASQGCPLSLLRKHRPANTYAHKFSRDVVKLLNECIWEFLSDGQPSKRRSFAILKIGSKKKMRQGEPMGFLSFTYRLQLISSFELTGLNGFTRKLRVTASALLSAT